MNRRQRLVGAVLGVTLAVLATGHPVTAAPAKKTVEISGRAFIFNHMSTGIPNATIRVREFPKLSAQTNELGNYVLKVPNRANVTPYIESGGPADLVQRDRDTGEPYGVLEDTHWNEIDLQTFHTRGQNIENANFQAPRDAEYNGLKALLQVPAREDGRPEQCVIVTTASARNVRDVDFRTYWLNTPHGVEGATSRAFPKLPAPTYFNYMVIPDPNQPHASNDGGIIWPVVPTGTYRIVTTHPETRFASFLATCRPGRVVNANPPMGAYQLNPGEKPRTFSNVAASIKYVTIPLKRWKRVVIPRIDTGENVSFVARVHRGGMVVGQKRGRTFKAKSKRFRIPIKRNVTRGKATLRVKITDASGVSFTTVRKIFIPRKRLRR